MATTVTRYSAFDVAAMDLTMGAPAAAGAGGARMAYLATQPTIQFTRDMLAPFGMDDGTGKYASSKHSVKLSAADPALVAWVEAVDARLLDAVVADPAKFFPKPPSEGVIRAVFKPTAKDDSDKHPPTIKFNLPRDAKTGDYTVPVVGADNTPVDPAGALAKFARVTPVAKLAGLWFAAGNFGVLWRPEYMRVLPPVPVGAPVGLWRPEYMRVLPPVPVGAPKVDFSKFQIADADDEPDDTDAALRSTTELLDGNTGLPYFADA